MKKYICYLGILLGTISCSNDKKLAQEMLEHAQLHYEANSYASARLWLDSLKNTYPGQINIQREALQLRRRVDLSEQERNLRYCDSMVLVCRHQADSLIPLFLFEKNEEYDEIGKYIAKSQKLENNLQKSYIRSGVNEKGEMYIASVYYGSKPLNHTKIKVSIPNGEFTETDNIPRDGGANYAFTDLGATTEVVTYQNGRDSGVIQFICDHVNDKLKVEYIGARNYSIQMSENDKKAVLELNALATVLSDIRRLNEESDKAKARIEYLKSKTE